MGLICQYSALENQGRKAAREEVQLGCKKDRKTRWLEGQPYKAIEVTNIRGSCHTEGRYNAQGQVNESFSYTERA